MIHVGAEMVSYCLTAIEKLVSTYICDDEEKFALNALNMKNVNVNV